MPSQGHVSKKTGTSASATEPSSTKSAPITPPTVSVPKGGAAIQGIGEKFAANPATGTGTTTIPLGLSPGRTGFGPQLSLAYDSGAGNGPFGFGWHIGLPSISRKTDKGIPQYLDRDESDLFILSGADDLQPLLVRAGSDWVPPPPVTRVIGADTFRVDRYRPRIEGLFARIERWTHAVSGSTHWRSISTENVTTIYGRDGHSRIADPADASRTLSWLICETFDDKGNRAVYDYVREDSAGVDRTQTHEQERTPLSRSANVYLKSIRYGNRISGLTQPPPADPGWMFEAVFDYDEGHYQPRPLNGALSPEEQHRFVRASHLPSHAWGVRPDPFSQHRGGFEVRTYRRCRRVLMFHRFPELGAQPCLVRCTELDYEDLDYAAAPPPAVDAELAHQGSTRFASFIRRVTHAGLVRDAGTPIVQVDGIDLVTYLVKTMPPVELAYSRARIDDAIRELDAESQENLPAGLAAPTYQWADLDGEGVPGLLTEQAGAWFYKANLGGGRFGPLQTVATLPSLAALGGKPPQQLLDLAGDGRLDLVTLATAPAGFYERTDAGGWEPFQPFQQVPNADWDDPNLRLVDLNGDGHADVLITEHELFTWHPSQGEAGFGPAQRVTQPSDERRGPALVLADGTQSIYLADMAGDGLTGLVRIRNGEICYWPSLGYGRFGARVSMDNAPWFDTPEAFSQRRVRLADIDGSGTTDIIYLGRDGARIYFNQSGNRWTAARPLPQFPPNDDLSAVTTADLLGNGTACLVWSSSLPAASRHPVRYIDLMGGQKPHLLVRSVNNLGAETHVRYTASTTFSLADKAAGRPWITKLPFPVHVVDRVETFDRVSRNRFVTRYAYHHGYFDGDEREFRGFGLVEQWDTEEIGTLSGSDLFPTGDNFDAASALPPVHTKTWFHTGIYLGRDRVSAFFAGLVDAQDRGEYYREPGLTDAQARTRLLDDTVLPYDLTIDEEREACRALKGAMLRQEVYAIDGTALQPHPYRVSEQNFTIELVQGRAGNRHAVLFTHPREAIGYHYERNPADPRISHSATLEVDAFGKVLKEVAVAYGRRQPDLTLPLADRQKQAQLHVTYSEHRVTNAIDTAPDAWRAPARCETRAYEITGLALAPGQPRFTFDALLSAGTGAAPIPYDQAPTSGLLEKRLIEQARTIFRRDDLSAALALGTQESLALPFDHLQLAFTPSLLSALYGTRVTGAMLQNEGGYVHSEGDANWWAPSGRTLLSPDPTHSAAQELAYARSHFFLPHRYRDPFHTALLSTETLVRYDAHDLLVQETRDAGGNLVTAGERNAAGTLTLQGNDYRVLQPALVMDPNRNRTAVAFDALGLVAGTASMGKPLPATAEGDTLAGFTADLTEAVVRAHLANPLTAPQAVLQRASTRVLHDAFAYMRTQALPAPQPAVLYTLARETHDADPVPAGGLRIQHTFTYGDGFGRVVQTKGQAEPGPAPTRDPDGVIIVGPDGQPVMSASDVTPRWVGTGWTVFNNKGKPVREYEPFFTDRHTFELDVRIGVSPVLFYDPTERIVATLHPDHTWEKVRFDPWSEETWDASDTVLIADPRLDPQVGDFFRRLETSEFLPTWHAQRAGGALGPEEQAAAAKAAIHADTPSVAYEDSLGRTMLTVVHNRFKYSNTPPAAPPIDEIRRTRVTLDIEGNEREIIDARERIVMRYAYDMLGHRTRQSSMEAGERWTLNDATGKPLYSWDSRGSRFRTAYDLLRRPTQALWQHDADPEILIGRTEYGDTLPGPEAANLRGKVVRTRDQSGIADSLAFDFKGNLLHGERRIAQAYDTTLDWAGTPALLPETYTIRTRYDALNRAVQLVAPHSDAAGSAIHVLQPIYNEANLLQQLDGWLDRATEPTTLLAPATATLHVVTNVDYDAKGQRVRVDHGNGARTTYAYDPLTSRLRHLLTRRDETAYPDDCPQPPPAGWPGCQVQNLRYTYDPAGNVTHIRDTAQQTRFFRNRRVTADNEYTYDASYRLIEATGREHLGQIAAAPAPSAYNDRPRVGVLLSAADGNAVGRYLERYVYDAAGNFTTVAHVGTDPTHPGWTRSYTYDEPSQLNPLERGNRLTSTGLGGFTTETYSVAGDGYDAHGHLLRLPHLPEMRWDFHDRLQMVRRQAIDAEDVEGAEHEGERTWYVYDAAGQRVRKVTERFDGVLLEERLYLGAFEIYRRFGPSALVRETLHVMDDQQRVALIETRTDTPMPQRLIRYQYVNHLGSASLELDDVADIISYEEHTPYGSTSYQAVRSQTETRKRHRFTGKERDEESGFYHLQDRYYAPWLGRWTSCDPDDVEGGHNLYAYAAANPVMLVDPTGRAPKKYEDQRARDTAAKRKEMEQNLADAKKKGHTPDPMQKRAENMTKKRGKTPIEQHHHKGVKEAAKTKLPPSKMGTPMSSLWSTKRDPKVSATIDGKPATHHNVGKHLDLAEQAKVPKTPAGLEQAADMSKQRLPATADLAERAKMDWKKTTPVGPPVDPKTGKVIKATEEVAEKTLKEAGKVSKVAKVGKSLAKAGRHFVAAIPIAGIVIGQASAAHAASQGDYTGAALDEAGFIPVVGDAIDAFRGGVALGEAAVEVLPIEKAAISAGNKAEAAAKYLGAGEDTARVVGGVGAAAGAIGEFVLWTNPVTLPFKVVGSFF